MNYNEKYKFISDGTWFKKGTEVVVDTDGQDLWHLESPYRDTKLEIPFEVLQKDKEKISGIFRGIRVCENPLSEGKWHTAGEEYEDGELCSLDEFEIIKK